MDEHCGKFSCEDKDGMQRAKELWDEEHEERQAESSIAPTGLDVVNLNDVYAEQYRLNGSYMLVLEDYDFQRGDAMISMFAPGFSQYFTERLESTYMTTRSMHQHAFFEFMYVMKGKAVQKIEGEEYACEAGQCCLLNHYVRHVETPVENTELFFCACRIAFSPKSSSQTFDSMRRGVSCQIKTRFMKWWKACKRKRFIKSNIGSLFRSCLPT